MIILLWKYGLDWKFDHTNKRGLNDLNLVLTDYKGEREREREREIDLRVTLSVTPVLEG